MLQTGWYFITDQSNEFRRKLEKSEEYYFIDPKPIAIQSNFTSVEMFETDFRGSRPDYAGLTIVLDDYGRKAYALATSKAHRLALVVNNKLISAPLVTKTVTDAFTFLKRGEFSKEDVLGFMKEMEIIK